VADRRTSDLLVPSLQVAADALAFAASFVCAYVLRFSGPLARLLSVELGVPPFRVYAATSAVAVVLWLIVFRAFGMYGARRRTSRSAEVARVLKAVSTATVLLSSLGFFYRQYSFSRAVCILCWAIAIVVVTVERQLVLSAEWSLRFRGVGLIRAALVGSDAAGGEACRRIRRDRRLGIEVVGQVGPNVDPDCGIGSLGPFEDVAAIVMARRLDALLLSLSASEADQLRLTMVRCAGLSVEIFVVPGAIELASRRVRVEDFGGIPALRVRSVALVGWGLVLKRAFDVLFSASILVTCWPLLLVIALAVRWDSPGPVFVRQRRVGLDGEEFTLVKFRTMVRDAEGSAGPVWAVRGDSRVTRVGRFLRRVGLDELPQLANVLRGEMSLVGPRPERRSFVEEFSSRIPSYLERHRAKSGITGWAQVHGLRGDTPLEPRIQHDIYYIENWSFLLDVKILFLTVSATLSGLGSR
jgi:exopolysaccharide biosynthesis polyprenyl glycosylphosphotransferase